LSRVALVLVVSLGFVVCGCGGVLSQSPTNSGQTTSANPSPPPSPAPASLSDPHIVSVGDNQALAGIDINVSTPQDSPTPNAQMLGVTNLGNGGSASNVGDLIHRGAKMTILMFGPGVNGGLKVSISGPNDIAISNIRGVTSIDGGSGLAFDAAVDTNAALGARTVRLRSPHDDMTTFTGGLEVLP
jgi:hypothetical protein